LALNPNTDTPSQVLAAVVRERAAALQEAVTDARKAGLTVYLDLEYAPERLRPFGEHKLILALKSGATAAARDAFTITQEL
jgi:hypothetical protein